MYNDTCYLSIFLNLIYKLKTIQIIKSNIRNKKP